MKKKRKKALAKKAKAKAARLARKTKDAVKAGAENIGRATTNAPPSVPPTEAPSYPESAVAVQHTPAEERKRRSLVKKKTIKAMHREINRRTASVGEEGVTMVDADVPDHEKFVTLTRQTGNVGDTLANTGGKPAPELTHSELVRLMALAGLWAQSLNQKRRGR
jgi:hypothetical protein